MMTSSFMINEYIFQDFLTPNNVIETNLVTFANAYLASSCSISEQQTDTCLNFPAV